MSKGKYSVQETKAVAEHASAEIESWLLSLPQTVSVQNVEEDERFQKQDVDLLWQTRTRTYKVEVKGDRMAHKTGNFFFETHSNVGKNTPGCFLYSEADLFFYYLVEKQELYILPLRAVRSWFKNNYKRFPTRSTTTPTRSGASYTTKGRLVPISVIGHVFGNHKACRKVSLKGGRAVTPTSPTRSKSSTRRVQ